MLDTSLLLDMMAEELRFSLNIPPGTRDFSRLDRAMIAISSERIVCHCLRVTEGQIKSAIDTQSVCTVREVMRCTGAGRGCMSCHSRIKAMLAGESVAVSSFVVPTCPGCSNPACVCEGAAATTVELAVAT